MKQSASPSVEEQQFSSFSFLNKRPALAPGHTLPLSVTFLFKQMNQMLTKTTNSEFDCAWLFQLLCNGLVLSMSWGAVYQWPSGKRKPAMQEVRLRNLGQEDPLEQEMAIHSSILAWRIPWTEEPGRLQSMGLQRVRCDLATEHMSKALSWVLFQHGYIEMLQCQSRGCDLWNNKACVHSLATCRVGHVTNHSVPLHSHPQDRGGKRIYSQGYSDK